MRTIRQRLYHTMQRILRSFFICRLKRDLHISGYDTIHIFIYYGMYVKPHMHSHSFSVFCFHFFSLRLLCIWLAWWMRNKHHIVEQFWGFEICTNVCVIKTMKPNLLTRLFAERACFSMPQAVFFTLSLQLVFFVISEYIISIETPCEVKGGVTQAECANYSLKIFAIRTFCDVIITTLYAMEKFSYYLYIAQLLVNILHRAKIPTTRSVPKWVHGKTTATSKWSRPYSLSYSISVKSTQFTQWWTWNKHSSSRYKITSTIYERNCPIEICINNRMLKIDLLSC